MGAGRNTLWGYGKLVPRRTGFCRMTACIRRQSRRARSSLSLVFVARIERIVDRQNISRCKVKSGSSFEEIGVTHARHEEDADGSMRIYHNFFSDAQSVTQIATHHLGHFRLVIALVIESLVTNGQNPVVVGHRPSRSRTAGEIRDQTCGSLWRPYRFGHHHSLGRS